MPGRTSSGVQDPDAQQDIKARIVEVKARIADLGFVLWARAHHRRVTDGH